MCLGLFSALTVGCVLERAPIPHHEKAVGDGSDAGVSGAAVPDWVGAADGESGVTGPVQRPPNRGVDGGGVESGPVAAAPPSPPNCFDADRVGCSGTGCVCPAHRPCCLRCTTSSCTCPHGHACDFQLGVHHRPTHIGCDGPGTRCYVETTGNVSLEDLMCSGGAYCFHRCRSHDGCKVQCVDAASHCVQDQGFAGSGGYSFTCGNGADIICPGTQTHVCFAQDCP